MYGDAVRWRMCVEDGASQIRGDERSKDIKIILNTHEQHADFGVCTG